MYVRQFILHAVTFLEQWNTFICRKGETGEKKVDVNFGFALRLFSDSTIRKSFGTE